MEVAQIQTTTNCPEEPLDIRGVETKFSEASWGWFENVFACGIAPGLITIALLGIPHEDLIPLASSTASSNYTYLGENQSSVPSEFVLLPSKYGKYFTNLEEDKDLIKFYQESTFFDEKDLEL